MFIENCRRLVLRRGVYLHVACWIYSPPSGDAIGVVGRIYHPGYSL